MKQTHLIRLAVLASALMIIVLVARLTGLTSFLSLDNLGRPRDYVDSFGPAAPLVFVLGYAVTSVAFLPVTPLTLLAGLTFGPILGTLYVMAGATVGLTVTFLVARYAARGPIASWVEENERLRRLDEEVERQGWRILVVTRLVPLFPFSLQNYAYGLTKIGLVTYVVVSTICTIPSVVVYTFAGGSVASGDLTRTFVFLGIAAVVFVLLSLLPGWLQKRTRVPGERQDGERPEEVE